SGDWLCFHWNMKIDSAFLWSSGAPQDQRKLKAMRIWPNNNNPGPAVGDAWTSYLQDYGVVLSCGDCHLCGPPGASTNGGCATNNYSFVPGTSTHVENWHDYTWGVKMQS